MVEVRSASQLDDLRELLASGGDVSIAVGYVDSYGLKIIEDNLETPSGTEQKLRILVNLKEDALIPTVVDNLVRLTEKYCSRFQCREYYGKGQGILHTKLFIAHAGVKTTRFLTGSANLTENALKHNKEHGVRVDCADDENLSNEVIRYFDGLWENDDCVTPLNRDHAETYRKNYERNQGVRSNLKELDPPPRHWLFKANVHIDTFADLCSRKNGTDRWSGIRQPQARDYIRGEMRKGDRLLFYHTGAGKPQKLDDDAKELPTGTVQRAVVGTAIVMSEARPDCTAWEKNSRFYDPKDDPECPKWSMVDIKAEETFPTPVRLENIRKNPELQGFYERNFHRQPMVPIQPVNTKEFQEILRMGRGEAPP